MNLGRLIPLLKRPHKTCPTYRRNTRAAVERLESRMLLAADLLGHAVSGWNFLSDGDSFQRIGNEHDRQTDRRDQGDRQFTRHNWKNHSEESRQSDQRRPARTRGPSVSPVVTPSHPFTTFAPSDAKTPEAKAPPASILPPTMLVVDTALPSGHTDGPETAASASRDLAAPTLSPLVVSRPSPVGGSSLLQSQLLPPTQQEPVLRQPTSQAPRLNAGMDLSRVANAFTTVAAAGRELAFAALSADDFDAAHSAKDFAEVATMRSEEEDKNSEDVIAVWFAVFEEYQHIDERAAATGDPSDEDEFVDIARIFDDWKDSQLMDFLDNQVGTFQQPQATVRAESDGKISEQANGCHSARPTERTPFRSARDWNRDACALKVAPSIRDGMVELSHDNNEGFEVGCAGQVEYLELDGEVARFQAFEIVAGEATPEPVQTASTGRPAAESGSQKRDQRATRES